MNIINNSVITLYGDRWLLDLLWWAFHNICKCQLCDMPETNIILYITAFSLENTRILMLSYLYPWEFNSQGWLSANTGQCYWRKILLTYSERKVHIIPHRVCSGGREKWGKSLGHSPYWSLLRRGKAEQGKWCRTGWYELFQWALDYRAISSFLYQAWHDLGQGRYWLGVWESQIRR